VVISFIFSEFSAVNSWAFSWEPMSPHPWTHGFSAVNLLILLDKSIYLLMNVMLYVVMNKNVLQQIFDEIMRTQAINLIILFLAKHYM